MRFMSIGVMLISCLALLSGCAGMSDNTKEKTDMQYAQSQKQECESLTASDRENMNYEYKAEELYANRDGNQIYGVIYIPQNAGEKMPTVIFSHGFGGNYQVGTQYARGLAAEGYVVYCFDFCEQCVRQLNGEIDEAEIQNIMRYGRYKAMKERLV